MGHSKKKNKNNKRHKGKKQKSNLNGQQTENETEHTIEQDDEVKDALVSHKRKLVEDDSDTEEKPRKKKKKQVAPTESTDNKKGKKSIRQMKREKFLQRKAEAEFEAKDQLKSQCVTYLSQWKHDRDNWKFMKAKQVWLYKNKFNTNLVPDQSWSILLEYFEAAKGNIRNMLLEDSNKIIKQMDDWTESQSNSKPMAENEEEATDDSAAIQKPEDSAYKRARDLIQCLAE